MNIIRKILNKIKEHYKTHYSFVIVPYDHKKYFQIRIKKLFAHVLLVTLLIIGCYTLGVTIVNKIINEDIDENVAAINVLKDTSQQQRTYILDLEEQLDIMNEKLIELETLETYIKGIVDYEEEIEEEKEE
ncbi:MAG: hypothetical protein MJA31_04505 [Clostridia bacterium]|nr:hypothetical protein [Clostridia bacterium]